MVAVQAAYNTEVTPEAVARAAEIQRDLDEADAARPPEFRTRFPVVAHDLVRTLYPDEWIALLPTQINLHLDLTAGRLIVHAPGRDEFLTKLRPIEERYPNLWLHTYFTGRHPAGVPDVRV